MYFREGLAVLTGLTFLAELGFFSLLGLSFLGLPGLSFLGLPTLLVLESARLGLPLDGLRLALIGEEGGAACDF